MHNTNIKTKKSFRSIALWPFLAATLLYLGCTIYVPSASAASPSREDIVRTARRLATQNPPIPYVWGGESLRGMDCSGFIYYVYRKHGISLPRTTWDQMKVGNPVRRFHDLRPGDLVFINSGSHAGIWLGDGQVAVASSSQGVTIQRGRPYWSDRFYTGRRILP